MSKPISREELIGHICQNLTDNEKSITPRTLQRDLGYINELFNIEIAYDRSAGGYIVKQRGKTSSEYEALLQNFELLSRIDNDSGSASRRYWMRLEIGILSNLATSISAITVEYRSI